MEEYSDYKREDKEEILELLRQYDNLLRGKSNAYLEEEAFEKIIEYYEIGEDFRKALQAVELAIEQFPYSGALLVRKADLLLNNRNYTEALELLDRASVYDNHNIDIYILKTEILLAIDEQQQAVALLEEALKQFDGEERVELLFELADVYDDYEDFEKVFDCLAEILNQEPNNEEALYKICFWTDYTGRNAESISLHQKIIDEYPYNELAWFNLGTAFQGLKLYEKAIDAYQYAIAIDEKFDYAYRNLGDAYIRIRKYKKAIESLEKVVELSKPEDVIFEAIGYCYEKIKNYALARFYYKKATHLNHENSYLFYKIAFTYYGEGKYIQSMKQLETALKMKKPKPEYYLLMADTKMALALYKEAIQYYMDLVRLKPKSFIAWDALVRSLIIAEHYDEALAQIENATRLLLEKPIFEYYRASAYFGLKDFKQALIHLETGLLLAPSLLKKFIQLNPSLLQHQQVADLIVKYKRKKRKS